MFVSVFHGQHTGIFCSENGADLLWNYFFLSPYFRPQKRDNQKLNQILSASISSYPWKWSRFTTRMTAILIMSSPAPSHYWTCMPVIASLLHMTGFHILGCAFSVLSHYNRQITVAFTLQIVNLTTRTVEQYNDNTQGGYGAVVDSMF